MQKGAATSGEFPSRVTPLGNPPSSNRTLLREGCAHDPQPVLAQGSGQPGIKNHSFDLAVVSRYRNYHDNELRR